MNLFKNNSSTYYIQLLVQLLFVFRKSQLNARFNFDINTFLNLTVATTYYVRFKNVYNFIV